MKTLILKLGAAGDVVRTTCLLRTLEGEVHWVTSDANDVLLDGIEEIGTCILWSKINEIQRSCYDLVINLEDSLEVAEFVRGLKYGDLFGSYLERDGRLSYTDSSREWFDLGIISRFGKEKADLLKYENRKSYQEMLFSGLGLNFRGEKYFLPRANGTGLKGDIAIAPEAGGVWPNKKWAYYEEVESKLIGKGYRVNVLPMRESILEHISDVKNHKCLISGDTLPMHVALGSEVRCISLFNCTSPWEIYDYGIQKKIISPLLKKYFYSRKYDEKATMAIQVQEVIEEIELIMGNNEE